MIGFNPQTYLETLGDFPDEQIDLARAALCLAQMNQPDLSLDRYGNHLKKMAEETAARHATLLDAGADDDVDTQLAALKYVLAEQYGYKGDEQKQLDVFENASLMRVIDRGLGMPVTLSILYIHAARAQGWDIAGLNMPGHFICRLQKDGARVMFDPFGCCVKLDAPDLRALIKKTKGPDAELITEYYEPASNRQTLTRLQNHIKLRQIEMEDYEAALKTVEVMRQIDPSEYRLLLDAGVLYARTEDPIAAIAALERYIDSAPDAHDRQDAAALLSDIRDAMMIDGSIEGL